MLARGPHQNRSRARAEGQINGMRFQLHLQVTDEAHPPHSGQGWDLVTARGDSRLLHPRGLRQTGTASSPTNWDFIIGAVKQLNELFTSSRMVTKFTGLNPAESPANGALRSPVLIATSVLEPWLRAVSIGTRTAQENHPCFVLSSRNRVRDRDSPSLLFHTASH